MNGGGGGGVKITPPPPLEKLPSKNPALLALNLVENLRRLVEGSDVEESKMRSTSIFFLFL